MSSTFPTPPPSGRAPTVVDLGAAGRFQIHPLPPRAALRVAFRVVKLLGEPIGKMLSGAGLEVDGLLDEDGKPIRLQFGHLLKSQKAREIFLQRLLEGLSGMEPDDLDELVGDLLLGQPGQIRLQHAAAANMPFVPVATDEMLDEVVPDLWGLLRLVQAAFKLSALPTSPDAGTSPSQPQGEATAATGTSSPPGPTPSV